MKNFFKIILLLYLFMHLNSCNTQNTVSQKILIQNQEIRAEKEKEDIMWFLPGWCENVNQKLFEFRACGIAKSTNLQLSRTRSELDARKQIIKMLSNECSNLENEKILYGQSIFNSTLRCKTGDIKIKYSQILKRKTERVNTNFITFTLLSLPHN